MRELDDKASRQVVLSAVLPADQEEEASVGSQNRCVARLSGIHLLSVSVSCLTVCITWCITEKNE